MGLMRAKLGDIIKPIAIERAKFAVGHDMAIAVVSKDISVATVHFEPGVGFFYCFKGSCCKSGGLPQIRYILPVVEYSTRDVSDYGGPVIMKYLPVGQDVYNSILLKDKINSDITAKDLYVTCTDEKYQKLSFEVLGDVKWKKDPVIMEQVKKLWGEYNNLIELSVARNLDEEAYLKAVAKAAQGNPAIPHRPVPGVPASQQVAQQVPQQQLMETSSAPSQDVPAAAVILDADFDKLF